MASDRRQGLDGGHDLFRDGEEAVDELDAEAPAWWSGKKILSREPSVVGKTRVDGGLVGAQLLAQRCPGGVSVLR